MRIAVFCPNLIGDTVMATPTIRALARDHELTAVIKAKVAPTLDGAPWFAAKFPFDPKGPDPDVRTLGLIRRLRAGRFEAAVLLPNSFRSAWIARLAGIPRRVGYARGGRGWLLTDRLDPPRDASGKFLPTPIVDYYARLAGLVGSPVGSTRLELFTTAADEAAADRSWSRLGLGEGGRPVVALNTGGAFGPAKSWPVEHFAALARRLADERGASVVALCGPGEREAAAAIARGAGHPRVVSFADEPLGLGLTKASVRRSSLMVTTDSGPRHFAAAFGVPVISLFGPTRIAWTRTRHPLAIHLYLPVPCGPCQKPACPLGHHRCMRDLTPGSVFEAAARMLERGNRFISAA